MFQIKRSVGFLVGVLALCLSIPAFGAWKYPEARRMDLVEDYHGTPVKAPFRWLEDDSSKETRQFNEAQNKLTFDTLREDPQWTRLKDRIEALWNFPRVSSPGHRGPYYFFSKNDGLQNQAILYVQKGLKGTPRVLLNPNKLSDDGTTALSSARISNDGSLMAYGISVHGSDRQEFRIRQVESGKDLPEVISWCKFTSVAWLPDNSGFYYNRFPKPGSVPAEDENNFNKVYFHQLGTSQEKDVLVFERPDAKELMFSPYVTEDGKWLVLLVYNGTDPRNGVYYRSIEHGGNFVRLFEPKEAMYEFIESQDTRFFIKTDKDAPRGRVAVVDVSEESPELKPVLPENPTEVLESVQIIGGMLLATVMVDAHSLLNIYDLSGQRLRQLELPGIGSVMGVSGHTDSPEFFFTFMSFLVPPEVHRMNLDTGEQSLFFRPEFPFDASGYTTTQVFVTSKDGTKVPMFLTHKKGLEKTGEVPVLLYGYGGFNINLTPYLSVARLLFVEAGGIYAVVNLRGGSEYGEEWHKAGMLGNKQNVFDDFIASARWFVKSGYSKAERIGIMGGSNGGLLVTACMLQAPDVFGAVVARVPVTDMLRYHRFTVGRYWVPEYGDAEKNPEHFKFLYKYSPLHNVQEGGVYPPLLVTTADTDDRVVPAHSRKFIAMMQWKTSKKNTALLRVETRAGHGAGKPTSKKIEEEADVMAFFWKFLGLGAYGAATK